MTRDDDDLYGLPREEFTAARRDLARRTRDAGDASAAARIEKLPKPTKAAWLVNRLVRTDPDAVAELTDLAAGLRAAHERADGPRLRELTLRRTELLRDLVDRATRDESPSESITRELEEMFTAAMIDRTAGERLRDGRIASVRDLSGVSAWPGLAVAPVARSESKPRAEPKSRREGRAAALAEAKAAVKAAESERAAADRACADAEAAVAEAEQRVREINDRLDAAEAAESSARRDLQLARRSAKDAERGAAAAWRRLQQVEESPSD